MHRHEWSCIHDYYWSVYSFLCNPAKDVDLRKWAAEGLAYLTLDADVKEDLVEDTDSLRSIVDLSKVLNSLWSSISLWLNSYHGTCSKKHNLTSSFVTACLHIECCWFSCWLCKTVRCFISSVTMLFLIPDNFIIEYYVFGFISLSVLYVFAHNNSKSTKCSFHWNLACRQILFCVGIDWLFGPLPLRSALTEGSKIVRQKFD